MENEKWFCTYPPEEEYDFIGDWVKDEKVPDGKWIQFEIEILKQAKSYDKGLKRLEKSFTSVVISSTDSEDQENRMQSEMDDSWIKSDDDVMRELDSIPILDDAAIDESDPTVQSSKRQALTESAEEPENKKAKRATKEDLDNMEKRIKKSLSAMKVNLQYEMREFYKKIVINSIVIPGVTESTTQLPTLPFDALTDFTTFDESIATDEEKKKSLVVLMTKLSLGENSFQNSTAKILKALLTKNVQLQYSGCGRKVKGVGKNNFSSTNTYKCMQTLIDRMYSLESGKLLSYVSRWFSGAGDRDGGKTIRAANRSIQE